MAAKMQFSPDLVTLAGPVISNTRYLHVVSGNPKFGNISYVRKSIIWLKSKMEAENGG